jgi:amino acid permease
MVTALWNGEPGRRLTTLEATSLMVGAGVGAGLMAVPALAERSGLSVFLAILGVGYAANVLIHLLLAEVLFRTDRDLQVVELMRRYVFRGRWGPALTWTVFVLLSLSFLANLAAYVAGEADILVELAGLPPLAAQLLVYAASAGVVFFGLRAVGVSERLAALLLVCCVALLAAGSIGLPYDPPVPPRGSLTDGLALYGMVMYAYYTFFAVPQVVQGLGDDRRAAVRAIVAGLAINGLLMGVVALVALGISSPVTEVAINGIADRIGPWAGVTGSVFILFAFMTSYWSVSLALADIIRERVAIGQRVSWLIATLPSLLVLVLGAWGFIEWLRLAGGAIGIVIALITIPMYVNARRHGDNPTPGWELGPWGGPAMLAVAFLATVLMAIGSLLAT